MVEKLIKLGFTVAVEAGAGDGAQFGDDTYRAAGAEVLPDAAALWAASDRPEPLSKSKGAMRARAERSSA